MKNKIIEIRKAGFVNKGAQLMLYAIIQELKRRYPDAKLSMAPMRNKATPYYDRAITGLYQISSFEIGSVQIGNLAKLIPKTIRDMYGIVLEKEVDVILDASGFSYSEQLSKDKIIKLSKSVRRWKRNGAMVIFMPQAFGPFNEKKSKKAMNIVCENADLIFPRDKESFASINEVSTKTTNIFLAPDFTNIIDGIVPDYFNKKKHQVCIIPNIRIVDHSQKNESDQYIKLLAQCINYLSEKQYQPFILIHGSHRDHKLAEQILSLSQFSIPIITEEDPLIIKGLIGSCEAMVGSRYHGLVSALSQGVPSIGIGWSHKYEMLFEEYKFSEGLCNINIQEVELKEKIDVLIDKESYKRVKENLIKQSIKIKKKTEDMWNKVFKLMDKL